jgi:DNA-binding GntR family transcriptional regulator
MSRPAPKVEEAPRRRASSRDSLAERAYRAIKQRILSTHYPPGAQVMEQELAQDLGMSRTPVREALVRLEKEGLCHIVPRRGMRVRALSPEDMREIYELLCCLEAKAVEAIALQPGRAATVRRLAQAVERMEAALESDDLERWAVADDRFHHLIFEQCGNRRLRDLGLSLLEQARRVRMFTLRLRQKPIHSTADHRELIGLIEAGDARAARDLNWHHRVRAAQELIAILERYQLRHL